jgi:hypothetical protein
MQRHARENQPQPLVKLLGDITLDEINNRRLVGLKEKTFPWKFSIGWVPGKLISAPDATSTNPQDNWGNNDAGEVDIMGTIGI